MSLGIYNSNAFKNAAGVQVVPNANVEVRRESDGGLAEIYSTREADSNTEIDQVGFPLTTGFKADADGYFEFYAAGIAGGYQVRVYSDDLTLDKTLRFQPTGNARERDAGAAGAAVMGAETAQAAREAAGIKGDAGIGKVPIGDGSEFIQGALSGFAILNGYLDWSVAANVLTVAVKTWDGADPSADDPVYISFRDATPATGLPVIRKLTAATSISINDTATLGTINSTAFRLWCVAFDDGGTVRLALINCLAGTAPSLNIFPLAGWGIANSTLEDNASDSAHVFYSAGAAVAAKAYATLGYATWEAGLATAGTWSAGPTRAQMFGPGVPLPGQTIQVQRTQTGAAATGTSTIPHDDTIPQSTEGTEVMTQAITPRSAADVLVIEAQAVLSHNAVGYIHTAIFRDAIADALTANSYYVDSNTTGAPFGLSILHYERANAASPTTFKVTGGSGTAGTLTFNGQGGGRQLGGVYNSYLQARELMA